MYLKFIEMKTVVIRKFAFGGEIQANMEAEMLRENGIECFVNGGTLGTLMPFLANQVSISVFEKDEAQAKELLLAEDQA